MTTILPADWRDVLDRVTNWLETSAEEATRRESAFRERFEAAPATPAPAIAGPRLLGELPAAMRSLDGVSQEADEIARAEEDALRQRVQRSETLRLKLAEKLGRSIG